MCSFSFMPSVLRLSSGHHQKVPQGLLIKQGASSITSKSIAQKLFTRLSWNMYVLLGGKIIFYPFSFSVLVPLIQSILVVTTLQINRVHLGISKALVCLGTRMMQMPMAKLLWKVQEQQHRLLCLRPLQPPPACGLALLGKATSR